MAYTNYIHRTPSSNGNRQKFTISTWVKKTNATGQGWIITVDTYSSGNMAQLQLDTGSYIGFQQYHGSSNQTSVTTNNLLRDVNAWYHLVLRVDTTQSTAADRVRIYINGTEASYDTTTYPSQNFEYQINHTTKHSIGSREDTSSGSSLYYSHYHLCDGYSYAPTEFGETDSTTGEWKIKTSPSVSYGTNGFFIFKDGMNLSGSTVQDQSGQSHNLTLVGTSVETQDNPSNVFATFNTLFSNNPTLSGGNLIATASGGYRYALSTIAPTTGKYYAEFKLTTDSGYTNFGVENISKGTFFSQYNSNSYIGEYNSGVAYQPGSSSLYHNGSSSGSYGGAVSGDIIGIAMDLDNGFIYWSKNGTFLNSGVPTSAGTGTGGYAISNIANSSGGNTYAMGVSLANTGGGRSISANFGNGYFGTTAISSEGTNASGIGKFEYDVPAGYTALSTKGLNE
jgi:hypothetical protein